MVQVKEYREPGTEDSYVPQLAIHYDIKTLRVIPTKYSSLHKFNVS